MPSHNHRRDNVLRACTSAAQTACQTAANSRIHTKIVAPGGRAGSPRAACSIRRVGWTDGVNGWTQRRRFAGRSRAGRSPDRRSPRPINRSAMGVGRARKSPRPSDDPTTSLRSSPAGERMASVGGLDEGRAIPRLKRDPHADLPLDRSPGVLAAERPDAVGNRRAGVAPGPQPLLGPDPELRLAATRRRLDPLDSAVAGGTRSLPVSSMNPFRLRAAAIIVRCRRLAARAVARRHEELSGQS